MLLRSILTVGMVHALICPFVNGVFHSCKDIYANDPKSASGTYQIMNRKQEPYTVYCDFYTNYGYTYISNATAVHIDIDDLYTTNQHALVRHLTTSGAQKSSRMEQLTTYSSRYNLTFFYNEHNGFAESQNHQQLAPYLYMGFQPMSLIHPGTTEGYRCNGVDYTFSNCDGNPNSYMVFYFNKQKRIPIGYYTQCCDTTLMHEWVTHATSLPTSRYLPPEFYFFFEMHMGGCGGYAIPNVLQGVKGAALGLRFDYSAPCNSSPCHNGAQCYNEGQSFVCECRPGFVGVTCSQVS